MTAWERDLAAALEAHALIEAGDQARGITSSAALRAMWAVRHAIAQAEADGATEEQLDQVIARETAARATAAENFTPSNDESRPKAAPEKLRRGHKGAQEA